MLQWTRNIEISEIQGVPKESVEIVEKKDYVQWGDKTSMLGEDN